ncbi:MAG: hypothetical protein VW337_03010 [Gammaproteobacteria bacterium]
MSDNLMPDEAEVEYAGFWVPFLVAVLDSILLIIISAPLLLLFNGFGVFSVTESP